MYPELMSSKQAPWNKCPILRPVCTSLQTNKPLYEGQRIEITKPAENQASYQLVSTAEQSHKNSMNPWKTLSFLASNQLPRLRGVTRDLFSLQMPCFPRDFWLWSLQLHFSTLACFSLVPFNFLLLKRQLAFCSEQLQKSRCLKLKETQTPRKQFMSRLPRFFDVQYYVTKLTL